MIGCSCTPLPVMEVQFLGLPGRSTFGVHAETGIVRALGFYTPRPCGPLCRPEVGVPSGPRDLARGGVLTSARTMAANFVGCLRDRGESVKGGTPPFTNQQ